MLTGILSLQAVTANMIRDDGWLAIEAGRWIERSLQVCLLLRSTVVEKRERFVELSVLEMVLASAESAVTQRRRYRGNVRVYGVLELLLLDARNPRS
ncbi:alpha-E domain-containing protein, partial [Klebsiella grimontii]